MKICVIGLGSMGKRRIRLLSEHDGIQIIGVDNNEARRQEVTEKHGIETYGSIAEAIEIAEPDAAFVCTSPIAHGDIIHECLELGLNVFTEINLIDDRYDENMKLAKEKGLVLFLSSTFLYRPETEYIIKRVGESNCKVNYIYHIGQYLPDWHPWESYNSFFVGNKRTNGCREILAIELPWIVSCFGDIVNVFAIKSKNTELKIDYPDNYLIQIEHANGIKGVLAVDIVARKAVRKFEVYGEDIYLTWNGTPDSVTEYDIEEKADKNISMNKDEHISSYASFVTENPYRFEIDAFLKELRGEKAARWSFEQDKKVLNWIDVIEG